MGQHDAGLIRGEGSGGAEVELADPGGGIGVVLVAQQGAGQHHGSFAEQGATLQQHLQVGGAPLPLPFELRPVPQTPGSAVVVVAGDHQHRQRQLADRLQHLHHGGARHGGGIKQIAGHHHEAHAGPVRHLADAADGGDPLLLEPEALGSLRHPLVGLADLPVGGVEEAHHRQTLWAATPRRQRRRRQLPSSPG